MQNLVHDVLIGLFVMAAFNMGRNAPMRGTELAKIAGSVVALVAIGAYFAS